MPFNEEPAAARLILQRVRDVLTDIHGTSPFVIIAVMAADRREPAWNLPGIEERYLTRMAPWTDNTDGHVSSWDRLFREFPHKEPMRLSGY